MTYNYSCKNCNFSWEERLPMSDRDAPCNAACPSCNTIDSVCRDICAPGISYAGAQTILQRAGSGWNDVLTKVKKASGQKSTIETR